MNRLLQEGDTFTCRKFLNCEGTVKWRPSGEPYVDFTQLSAAEYRSQVNASWTEKGEGGWTRSRTIPLNPYVDHSARRFLVQHTEETPSSYGRDLYDVYSGGHRVVAYAENDPGLRVVFYQTGDHRGLCRPEDVELVESEP